MILRSPFSWYFCPFCSTCLFCPKNIFFQIKTNSIQWTTHYFVVYSFNITTFIKRQYLHLSGDSWLLSTWGLEVVQWKIGKFLYFQKVANFILFQTNFSSRIFPQTRMLFAVKAWFKYVIQIQQTYYFIFYLSAATFCSTRYFP